MFGRDAYMLLVHLLNPKIRYMGDDKILPAVDVLTDIALTMHNIKLPRERQADQFLTYPIS